MQKVNMKHAYIKKRGIISHLFSRSALIILLFLVEVVLIGLFAYYIFEHFLYFFAISYVLTIISIVLINFSTTPLPYKIAWYVVVSLVPVVGALIYFIIRLDIYPSKMRKKYMSQMSVIKSHQSYSYEVFKSFENVDDRYIGLAKYLASSSAFPIYKGNDLEYISTGEESFQALINAIKHANKYIMLEFFIIKDGFMWQTIISELSKKVSEGVVVKILYDGINEMFNLPRNYPKRLAKLGFDVRVFAPPKTPFVNRENYRNHRKTVVIDGNVAFVGGINIADEYINIIQKFGYWKDCVLQIKGNGASSFVLTFLSMWNQSGKEENKDIYLSQSETSYNDESYIIPFVDGPFDDEHIAFNVYLEILSKAKDYVYISTPYLVLEQYFIEALSMAAKRGVDVRILLPKIPDKKLVKLVAETHYKTLIKDGIKIYEFTPGFNHSKLFVSDDVAFVVGSINLDYRSFYLNYENAVFGYDKKTAIDIKNDLVLSYNSSQLIDKKEYKKINIFRKFLSIILRIFSPML